VGLVVVVAAVELQERLLVHQAQPILVVAVVVGQVMAALGVMAVQA
jgi:hypothetical protein